MPFSFFLARAKCGKSGSGSEALGMTAGRPPVERAFYGPQFAWVLIRVGYLVLHYLKATFGTLDTQPICQQTVQWRIIRWEIRL